MAAFEGIVFSGQRIDNDELAFGWYLEIGGKPYIRTYPKKKNGVSWDHFIKSDTLTVRVAGVWFKYEDLAERICS